MGFIVDDLIQNQEIMAKPISHTVQGAQYFSGSTILGDGSVALIVDVPALVQGQMGGKEKISNLRSSGSYGQQADKSEHSLPKSKT